MNISIRKALSITLTSALIAGCLASCSKDLGPETLPSTTESTEATTTTEETTETTTETTETTVVRIPSSPIRNERPVDINGQLKVDGANIVNKDGSPYQLRGVSSCNLNECPDLFTDSVISTLALDWGCDVIRLSFNGDVNDDPGYAKMEEEYFNKICTITDSLIDQGLYVIIDWQIKENGDPMQYKDIAVDFFSRISAIYGDKENIIYEICSNPNGTVSGSEDPVDWARIKKYAKAVTNAIRKNDPDNIIICGTPEYSTKIADAADSPLKGDNICYAYHFSCPQEENAQEQIEKVLDKKICIFVSEWYPAAGAEDSNIRLDDAKAWLDYLDSKNVSWVSWPIGTNGAVPFELLNPVEGDFTDEDRSRGHWADVDISNCGLFVRDRLKSYILTAEE